MRKVNIAKHMTAVLLALMMALSLISGAFAAETGSLTYSYPLDGVTFRLYRIGELQDDKFVLTGDFAQYPVELNSAVDDLEFATNAAETLAGYIERDSLQPIAAGTTADGKVVFEDLEQGAYLLLGETTVAENMKWTPSAVLFSVYTEGADGQPSLDVTAGGKYSREQLPNVTTVTAQKIWEDEGYEEKRPESIDVQLLKDGELYDTRTLSALNNWTYTWENLDANSAWTVVEAEVPENYKVSAEVNDNTVVIVNTYETPESPTPSPSTPTTTTPGTTTPTTTTPNTTIPQTGQLWWPVGILAVTGIGLVLIGLIRREKDQNR